MSYKQELQNNNADLQSVLDTVNSLSTKRKPKFPNGTEWTQSNIANYNFTCIRYANGIWVAGCNSSYDYGGLYYSTDGKTWIQSNVTNININFIHNGNGIWVASDFADNVYHSTDGISWTKANIVSDGVFYRPNYIYYANGIWVACGSNYLYYSTDCTTWKKSNALHEFNLIEIPYHEENLISYDYIMKKAGY